MNIQLNQDQMMELCSAAILQAITEEQKTILIKNAIVHLMTPSDGQFGRQRISPLAEAFNRAMDMCATKLVAAEMEKDEGLKAKLRDLYAEACVRIFDTNREQTVNKVAEALTRGMAYQER